MQRSAAPAGRDSGRKWLRLANDETATHSESTRCMIQSTSWQALATMKSAAAPVECQLPPDERVREVPEPDRLKVVDVDDVAQGARADQRSQQPCVGRVPQHVGHQDGGRAVAQPCPQTAAVHPGPSDRLLKQHGHTQRREPQSRLDVQVVHGRDDHAVDLSGVQLEGVPAHRLPRGARSERVEETPTSALVGLGNGHDLRAVLGGQAGVAVAPRAGPDHRQPRTPGAPQCSWAHAFIPVRVMPRMRCFCTRASNTTSGTIDTVAAAMVSPQSTWYWVTK